MKKLLLVLLMLSAGAIKAYTLKVINNSGLVLNVDATYGGAGVCSTDNFQMAAGVGTVKEKGTGACCLNQLIVRAPSIGQTRVVQGHLTGYGISCRSNTFKVKYIAGGQLAVELQ